MPVKIQGVVSKVKLTDDEKLSQQLAKGFASMLEKHDTATINRGLALYAKWGDTLNQQGEQQGKRFNGSADHEFASNANAFVETVRRGNIPKIG